MKVHYLSAIVLFFFIQTATSQFKIDADLRARFEYRHGFNNLFPDGADPAAFVAQRSRINLDWQSERLQLAVSVQDVSTWGDTRQILPVDGNDSFSLYQAWVQYQFASDWYFKAGRQPLNYDDQRILGALDWAMQGRFHDAAMLKWEPESFKLHLAAAFSQEEQRNEGTDYAIEGFFTYKVMQMAWWHKDWNSLKTSVLFLNTGFQQYEDAERLIPDGVYYRQTAGTYMQFPLLGLNWNGSFYYQFGKAAPQTDLSAWQFLLEANWKPNNWSYGIGVELLSGTDQGDTGTNNSFFPLYGTNHKFNGYMDYFYVGNHANNVGLNDLYAQVQIPIGESSNILVKGHYFASNADLLNTDKQYLGTELDVVYTAKVHKFVQFNLGYSHMFASDQMSQIKGGRPNDNTNLWGWAQLIVNPNLLTWKPEGSEVSRL